MKVMAIPIMGVLLACTAAPAVARAVRGDVSGHPWALRVLQGERVAGRRVATIRFNPDRTVSGGWACNTGRAR